MSTGLPVVTTKIPGSGTSWVNAHGVSGLNVSCGNPEELAEALTEVIRVENETGSYGRNARDRWEKLFTVETSIDNVSYIYRQLLESR